MSLPARYPGPSSKDPCTAPGCRETLTNPHRYADHPHFHHTSTFLIPILMKTAAHAGGSALEASAIAGTAEPKLCWSVHTPGGRKRWGTGPQVQGQGTARGKERWTGRTQVCHRTGLRCSARLDWQVRRGRRAAAEPAQPSSVGRVHLKVSARAGSAPNSTKSRMTLEI